MERKGFFMISLIIGSLLTLMGISILINVFFGFHIPVFKVFFAAFLIGMGLKILFFPHLSRSIMSCCKKEERMNDNYAVAFSSSTIDLRHLNTLTTPKTINICSKFAHVDVFLPANVPVRVKSDTAFGSVDLPGHEMSSEYVNLHGASEPMLTVYIDSKFSSVTVRV